jgi:hypothetical protein
METSNQNKSGGAKKWIGLFIPILGIALYLFQGHLWEDSIDPQDFKARAENERYEDDTSH